MLRNLGKIQLCLNLAEKSLIFAQNSKVHENSKITYYPIIVCHERGNL